DRAGIERSHDATGRATLTSTVLVRHYFLFSSKFFASSSHYPLRALRAPRHHQLDNTTPWTACPSGTGGPHADETTVDARSHLDAFVLLRAIRERHRQRNRRRHRVRRRQR